MLLFLTRYIFFNGSLKVGLLFFCLHITINITSQDNIDYLPPKFQNLSFKDGLSNLSIHSICQDNLGYMWIGTARGLNRYDGNSFKHFYYDGGETSLLHDDIIELHKAPNGDIICHTRSGINIYKIAKEKLIKTRSNLSNLKWFTNYDSLVYSTKNSKGLYKLSADLKHVEQVENFPKNDFIKNLISDPETGIWAKSTKNQFIINYKPQTSNYKKYFLPDYDSLTMGGHIALIQKHLLITTNTNIHIFDIEKESFEDINDKFGALSRIKNKTINFIKQVENNILWIGTTENGLYIYDLEKQTIKNHQKTKVTNGLYSNHLTCFYKDKSNNIWLGTFDRGIEVAFKGRRNFNYDLTLQNFTKDKFITCICSDHKGNYYMGTRLNGLFIYNAITKNTTILNKTNSFIKTNNIRSLLLSSNNELWIGTQKQLHILNLSNHKHRNIKLPKPNNGLVNFCESNNKVFAGLDRQGLIVFSLEGEQEDIIRNFNKNVTQILQQKDGKLIVAAHSAGCFLYDYDNKKISNIKNVITPSLNNLNQIVTIFMDSKENLWIGNFKYGLYRITKDQKNVTIFNMKSGLPSNDITAIIEDDLGNIWVSTAYGLSMLNQNDKFTNYSYNEGVDNIQFHQKAAFKDKYGTLFFGGNYGLTFFNPNVFKFESNTSPHIQLETLKVLNREVTPDDATQILSQCLALSSQITLSHQYPSFSIEYRGFDYVAAQNMKYAYILEGSDKDWNYVNKRTFASYQNLKPGDYTFKVKAQNNNGIWSEKLATLNIKVQPAPWLSPWAYVAYLLTLILLIYGTFWFVLYINHFKNELEIEHNERIRENDISQMKMRFFTNISHEIRTPVTLIKGNVDFLISELSERKITVKSIGSLKNSTDRLLKLINQLLSFRQLENDALDLEVKNEDIIKISKEMVSSFQHTAKLKNISIEFKSNCNELIVPLDHDKYEKILNNLLSNSLKFSNKDGQIKVLIEEQTAKELSQEFDINKDVFKYIKVSVIDNGKGILKSELPYIFERYTRYSKHNGKPDYSSTGIGLNFSKRLIELHHGSIIARSDEGTETCFSFIIPTDDHIYAYEKGYTPVNAKNEDAVIVTHNNIESTTKPDKVILIAEDDIELNKFIQDTLSPRYQVISTYDGKEALKEAKKIIPDIILSDIMMPEMDGISLCKAIRNDKLISHIPVILLTAKTEVENKITGFNHGADEYITKPFELKVLKARIQNLIQQRSILQQYYKKAIPVEYKKETVNHYEEIFMKKINHVVEENYASAEFNVHQLAEKMNMSRTSFYRKFLSITETPPKDYITNYRINKSMDLIHTGIESLGEISYLCGFSSQTIFSNSFKKTKGVLPLQYKKSLKK